MYEVLFMSKTVGGDSEGIFTSLTVNPDDSVVNDLTVNGVLTAAGVAVSTLSGGFFTATDANYQYRFDAGTMDLKSTTSGAPTVRLLNNVNNSGNTTLQTGIMNALVQSSSVQYSSQENTSTGAAGGAGWRSINNSGNSVELTMRSSNHSTKPNHADLLALGSSEFHIGTNNASPLNFRYNGANVIFMNNTGFGYGGLPTVSLDIGTKTDAIVLPKGTTAQRPTAATGQLRYNTTTASLEAYDTSKWNTLMNGPYVEVTRNTNQAISSTNTFIMVQYNNVVTDSKSCYNTSNYRFTPTTPGFYAFTSRVETSANLGMVTLSIWKSNTSIIANSSLNSSATLTGCVNCSGSCYMNGTTDYVETFLVYTSGSGNIIGSTSLQSGFSGTFIQS